MKLFRSKSIAVQRKSLQLAIDRTKKVSSEIRELSLRDWRGGETLIAQAVNEARDSLTRAVASLNDVESHLKALEELALRKGK